MTAVDPGRLALAAAEAGHALDHGWPHPPSSDELADLYRSDEDAARTLRTQRQPVTMCCSVCGGTGRVQMAPVGLGARP